MLEKLSKPANPAIEGLLNKLRTDEVNYPTELRSADRDKLVFPVSLTTLDGEFEILAFSRDMSPGGLGLITPQPFSTGTRMKVGLRLHTTCTTFVAECRWCLKFGESYWKSGWEIQEVLLDVASIKMTDAAIENDERAEERKKFAIPVVVQQPGGLPRVHGFSRNMSGNGANLVVNQQIQAGQYCQLEFVGNDGERCGAVAECIWTRKFGDANWLTGWTFADAERAARFNLGPSGLN